MLGLRLQSVVFWARTLASSSAKVELIEPGSITTSKATRAVQESATGSKFKQSGPELQITKILIKNGPLTSREIWRSYQIDIESKQENNLAHTRYFNSLSQLKKTLGYMRTNQKIKGSGYDKKKKMFLGWRVDQKKALKYVHPDIVSELSDFKKNKNEL